MRGTVVFGLAACAASVSQETPRGPLVVDAGREPRFSLRYAIADGSSHELRLIVRVNSATVASRGTVSRHGDTLEMRANGGVRVTVPVDARGYPDTRLALPRLPEDPVGAGATWSYDTTAPDLIPAPHHHVATLTDVTATTVSWHEVETVSEPRRHYVLAGKDWDVGLSGNGDTYVSIDFAASTVDVTTHFTLTIIGSVNARPRHLTFETTEHRTLE